jgi:AcrR family transcriptional regulator
VPEPAGDTQAPPRPRGRPRDVDARDAIVGATLDLLAKRGFQAATMDEIASKAGVGKNTIYRRWPSKEELIVDALRDLAPEPTPTARGDLRALLLDYLHGQEREFADPRIGKLLPGLLGELQTNPEFALVWVDRVVRPRRRAIVDVLTKALERGELRQGVDPDLIADLLLGPPFLRLLFPLGLPPVPKWYSEELLETIWHGVKP